MQSPCCFAATESGAVAGDVEGAKEVSTAGQALSTVFAAGIAATTGSPTAATTGSPTEDRKENGHPVRHSSRNVVLPPK